MNQNLNLPQPRRLCRHISQVLLHPTLVDSEEVRGRPLSLPAVPAKQSFYPFRKCTLTPFGLTHVGNPSVEAQLLMIGPLDEISVAYVQSDPFRSNAESGTKSIDFFPQLSGMWPFPRWTWHELSVCDRKESIKNWMKDQTQPDKHKSSQIASKSLLFLSVFDQTCIMRVVSRIAPVF